MTDSGAARPEVVFDGDCGICREWIDYWHALTGDRFVYRTLQQASADHPEVDEADFLRALHFLDTDGQRYTGAAATFRIYRDMGLWRILEPLYRHLPLFASASEFFYRFFADRRWLLAALTHFARGRNFKPAKFELTSWLFLRLLGLVYFAAMASFAVQAKVLIASDGIAPLGMYLSAIHNSLGASYWYRVPMLFWFNHSDTFIQELPILGCIFAVAVALNVLTRLSLVVLFVIYLTLYYGGQTFMSFQWDLELLEAGFLAILLTSGSRAVPWLYRWLVFRFIFLAGAVKILSGDPTWQNLTALEYHFETQPLPSPLAWYAYHLPDVILKAGVAATLVIELALPFLIFAPRRLRMFAAWCFIFLQVMIILTGNYTFFNLLTIILCLFLFDDAALRCIVPGPLVKRLEQRPKPSPAMATRVTVWAVSAVIVLSSSELLIRGLNGTQADASWLIRAIAPCQCVNNYGPFAVMTTRRHEIVIEGSADGKTWKEYDFKYKPGDLARRPAWIIPHQPRVDWQMWFAALGPPSRNQWFINLLVRLLDGTRPVHSLFRVDPFPDTPPEYVRARYYLYRFTTPEEHRKTGNWWTRKLLGDYYPAVGLSVRQSTH
ncbi:MAG TPA: lipase maturation factor family protein [Pseudomonadales bacterium]|nr:lipase maturation factor family protein [Pseudomonadales bacterium]